MKRDKEINRWAINIPMISRGAVTLPGNTVDAHRGIWFYDPTVVGPIEVGDEVTFVCAGETLARGVVTDRVNRGDFEKFCSAINSEGFHWEDMRDVGSRDYSITGGAVLVHADTGSD